ncbi:MAG: hypothetical protein JNL62_10420, partial [Bryobacterales bacterium]|nr:hypothetical protein [Bryobacterales bacterium]
SNPAQRGSVLRFYASGLGETEPEPADEPSDLPPKLKAALLTSIGGIDADIVEACMAPGPVPGLYLIATYVPPRVNPGLALPLLLTAGGIASQLGVTVAIQ